MAVTPLTPGRGYDTLPAPKERVLCATSARYRAQVEGMRLRLRRDIAWCNAQPWRGNPGLRTLRRQLMSAEQWCNRLLGERNGP